MTKEMIENFEYKTLDNSHFLIKKIDFFRIGYGNRRMKIMAEKEAYLGNCQNWDWFL